MKDGDYSRALATDKFVPMTREEIIDSFTKTLDRAYSLKTKKVMVSFNIGLHEGPDTTVGMALRLNTPSYMMLVANMLSVPILHGEIQPEESLMIPHMAIRMAREYGAQE